MSWLWKRLALVLLGYVGATYTGREEGADILGDQSDESTLETFGRPSFLDRIDKIISSFSPKSLLFLLGTAYIWLGYKKK